MSIETEIVSRLEDDSTFGNTAGDRIYPDVFPQDFTPPAVRYQVISSEKLRVVDGSTDRTTIRFSFLIVAARKSDIFTLESAMISSLHAFRGVLDTIDASIFHETSIDNYQEDTKHYGRVVDFMVSYKE